MSKFNKSKEWVINEYIIKDRSREEVAKECGLSIGGLKSYLKVNNIHKENLIKNISKEELSEKIDSGMNVVEICEYFNCSKSCILRRCEKYGLKIKEHVKYEQYDSTNDDLIISLYIDGLSSTQIGKILNMSHRSVLNHLKKCNIDRRSLSESQWVFNDKEMPKDLLDFDIMYDLYINKRKSKKDIGKKYNCSPKVIDRVLRGFGIKLRDSSESKIGLFSKDKHPNWKGGICSLYERLRTYFNNNLSKKALERDSYTCQCCGSKVNLHVHHIKHFKDIVNRICNEHQELDVSNNINELYDIIIKDDDFNDMNNLITYCRDCHMKVHNYKRKN